MKLKSLFLLSALILLSSCKVKVSTGLKVSDILNPEKTVQNGIFEMEIPSCHDDDDSSEPSPELLEAQGKISYYMPEAKYNKCYNQNYGIESFVSYTLPISFDKNEETDKNIHLVKISKNGTVNIGVQLSQTFIKKIEKATSGSLQFDFKIGIYNDTTEEIQLSLFSVYLDDNPVIYAEYNFKPGEKTVITLSDVVIDVAKKRPAIFMLAKQAQNNTTTNVIEHE